MRKIRLAAILFTLTAPAFASDIYFDASVTGGYRQDNLNWNIASDPSGQATPNILSELQWNDLRMIEVKGDVKATMPSGPQIRGAIGYGMTVAGDNQDSDYYGDNRTLEFSRSNNDATGGDTVDFSLGAGWRIGIGEAWGCQCMTGLAVTPLAGWSWNRIKVRMKEGHQTVSAYGNTMPLGKFDGLNSVYQAKLNGPWVGAEVSYDAPSGLSGYARAEIHKASYEATADWNLRDDFAHPKSYEHVTDITGYAFNAGVKYLNSSKTRSYKVDISHTRWDSEPGRDTVFTSAGASISTRLNKVEWDSTSVAVGMEFYF